jgi:hypothetical protein
VWRPDHESNPRPTEKTDSPEQDPRRFRCEVRKRKRVLILAYFSPAIVKRLKAKMAGIARIDQPHKHNYGFFVRVQHAGNVFGAEARLPQSQTVGHSRSTRRLAEHGMRALNYESKNERYTA